MASSPSLATSDFAMAVQHDCGRVPLFLHDPAIEPTNNRAERGLRPAVIARSHCSKNERGPSIYETMKSITATLALRGLHVASALADLIRSMPFPAPAATWWPVLDHRQPMEPPSELTFVELYSRQGLRKSTLYAVVWKSHTHLRRIRRPHKR